MCAIKNLSKTKALETAPIHENEILTYIFKVNQYYCLLSLLQRWGAGSGYE